MNIGDRVIGRYGDVGTIYKSHYNFWSCSSEFLSMTGQEWLDKQTIPFSEDDLEEMWYSVALDEGGSIISPLSKLELV